MGIKPKKYFLYCVIFLFFIFIVPVFNSAYALISDGANAIDALGQYSSLSSPTPLYTKGGINNGPNELGFSSPTAIVIDTTNHRLFVVGQCRVLVYNLNIDDTLPDYLPIVKYLIF